MAEAICFPGFPQIIVDRGFAYQWHKARGWDESERGFGSLDYFIFSAPAVDLPFTDPQARDYWLDRTVGKEYASA